MKEGEAKRVVKSGKLDAHWGRFFDKVFENRHRGDDQEMVVFETRQVEEMVRQAMGFVREIRSLLDE